jgi:Zn-dependent protease with chaperone function
MANWYYLIGAERRGPITEHELRALAQTGKVTPSTLVWKEGMQNWTAAGEIDGLLGRAAADPLDPGAAPSAPSTPSAPPRVPNTGSRSGSIDEAALKDPSESSAFVLVCIAAAISALVVLLWILGTFGGALVILGFLFLGLAVQNGLLYGYYRVNAIAVTPTQFPEIHAAAQAFATRLGRSLPEIYVVQDSIWNAFAARLIGAKVVVLNSALVDAILLKGDHRELAFIVGHELGHHYAGHVGFRHFVANWGGWLIWARLWYSRRCEFTCDRYGLLCAGSLDAAQRAICNMAVGAQLASRVDIGQARQQWESRRGEFFVRYRALYSTHPHVLDRLTTLERAAAELSVPTRA